MKFRAKLTIAMVLLLSLTYGIGGSLMIAQSFSASIDRERDAAVLIIHKHPKRHRTYDHIPQHAIPIRYLSEQKEAQNRRKDDLRIIINGYLFRRCMIISRRDSELAACSRKSRSQKR